MTAPSAPERSFHSTFTAKSSGTLRVPGRRMSPIWDVVLIWCGVLTVQLPAGAILVKIGFVAGFQNGCDARPHFQDDLLYF